MKKFMCIRKCQFQHRLFNINDVYEGTFESIEKAGQTENFVEVRTDKRANLVEGQPMKQKSHEQPMSKQVPQAGAETETVIVDGREIDIQKEKDYQAEIEKLKAENEALKAKPKKKAAKKKTAPKPEVVEDGQNGDLQSGVA